MEELVVYGNQPVEKFQMFLNQFPSKEEVRVNKMANNAEYLPINEVERLLDELYQGLWQTDNFTTQVVANEIVGSIDLKVFHPTAKTWLTRTGAAAVMIQQDGNLKDEAGNYVYDAYNKKVKDPNFRMSDIDRKYLNTLTKDYPHLKAECLKNAAKSLGVRFGRNLNRGKDDEYNYLSQIAAETSERAALAMQLLETAKLADAQRTKYANQIMRANAKTLELYINDLQRRQE